MTLLRSRAAGELAHAGGFRNFRINRLLERQLDHHCDSIPQELRCAFCFGAVAGLCATMAMTMAIGRLFPMLPLWALSASSVRNPRKRTVRRMKDSIRLGQFWPTFFMEAFPAPCARQAGWASLRPRELSRFDPRGRNSYSGNKACHVTQSADARRTPRLGHSACGWLSRAGALST